MDSYSWRGIMLAACAVSGFIALPQVSFAQNAIAPDKTLPVNTVVNFNDANKTYTITGGTQVGANQFHSFQDLSVPTANTAHFDNALTTANVIGRVTGSNISNIDGTLKTNGSTNLYLINPNGIIFGANAKLDIGGSFSASTANSFKFSDGSEFSATNPQAPSLLQVTMPLGLQYGKSSPAPVSNAGNLSVGKDLTLSGGSVTSTGSLSAPKGNLRLEAIAGDVTATQLQAGRALQVMSVGNVTIDAIAITGNGTNNDNNNKVPLSDGSFLAVDVATRPVVDIRAGVLPSAFFSAPEIVNKLTGANISVGSITFDDTLKTANGLIFLTNQFAQNSNLAGDISVGEISTYNFEGNAGSVAIDSKGGINVTTPIYAYSDNANGGAVNLLANGDITVAGIYTISNSYDYSIGGNISLLSRNGNIDTTQGNILAYSYFYDAGKVTLKAGQDVRLGNVSTASGYYGVANDIEVDARSVSMINSTLSSDAYGYGNAGNITINAANSVSFDNSRVLSDVNLDAVGKGGNISINGASVSFIKGAYLSSSIYGEGDAGNVSINASGLVSFFGNSQASSVVAPNAVGNAGNVIVNAGSVSLTNSGLLSSTLGEGNGGDVSITANGLVSLDSSIVSSSPINPNLVGLNGNSVVGKAGNVIVNAGSVSLTNSGLLSSTFGKGDAGDVTINAADSVLFNNSSAYSRVELGAVGKAGNVSIAARSVSLKNGASLSSSTYGTGSAGDVNINATGSVLLSGINTNNGDSSRVVSNVELGAIGNAGNVTINAGSLTVKDGAQISSSTSAKGDAGNITITTNDSVSFSGASIFSFAGKDKVISSGAI